MNTGGDLEAFKDYEAITPKGRTGNNHPQDGLEPTWENMDDYSINLSSGHLRNARKEVAEKIVLTMANSLPQSEINIKVTLNDNEFEAHISEVIEIDNTLFS